MKKLILTITTISILSLSTLNICLAISFVDISASAGISHAGNSFGISWGDLNLDGRPDIFLSNHFTSPSLYVNNGDGTFIDVSANHELTLGALDQHGSSWADYDNDGDQDLIIVNGGRSSGTAFLINDSGTLLLHDPLVTGLEWGWHDRTPTWLDEDNDGKLDIIISNITHKDPEYNTPLFRQNMYGNFDLIQNFGTGGSWTSILAGSSAPTLPDVLFNTGTAFVKQNVSWVESTSTIFPPGIQTIAGSDYAYGDVNGDGALDLYVIREGPREQIVTGTNSLGTASNSRINQLSGFDFVSEGLITVYFGLSITRTQFKLGVNESQPVDDDPFLPVVLDSSSAEVQGTPNIVLGDPAVWVWYTTSDSTWHFRIGSATGSRLAEFHIDSEQPISNVNPIGINWSDSGARNYLYLGDGSGGFVPDNNQSGISILGPSRAGVLADFDNDMDLDLYLVNRNAVDNVPNQIFENNGLGRFTEIQGAWGAEGSTLGSGESVSVADFDNDGFLDLFVSNGRSDLRMPYPGPHQLYKNTGNDNHWIELDLIGVKSNRDGIGTIVELDAGGITQIRYQDGGMHAYGQHHQRMHFGLAQHDLIDEIRILWPSGITQTISSIPANQLIQVREAANPQIVGAPVYRLGENSAVYVWQDVVDESYKLRVIGDPQSRDYLITLVSTQPIMYAQEFSLDNGHDALTATTHGFQLKSRVRNGQDGVDFALAPGAKTLISVTENGISHPRRLRIGPNAAYVPPSGWIFDADSFPTRPIFDPAATMGLFAGRNSSNTILEFRWSGDTYRHSASLDLISSEPFQNIVYVKLDSDDQVYSGSNWVHVDSHVQLGQDGIDVTPTSGSFVGFSFKFDSLLPSHLTNPENLDFGIPNAYLLQ